MQELVVVKGRHQNIFALAAFVQCDSPAGGSVEDLAKRLVHLGDFETIHNLFLPFGSNSVILFFMEKKVCAIQSCARRLLDARAG